METPNRFEAFAVVAFTVLAISPGVLALDPGEEAMVAERNAQMPGDPGSPMPAGDPCMTPGGAAIQAPYCGTYSIADLGSVPGLPPSYGGLTFFKDDPDILLIGGTANEAPGVLYAIEVVRDTNDHVVGFSGSATPFADAAYNDGGVAYGPGDVLFLARWPVNELGQTEPGSAITDKIIDLTPFGVNPSAAGLNFVPPGFPGAGELKLVSWEGGEWYTLGIAPDGAGTFDVTSATLETTVTGGPEGLVYVPPGSPLFAPFDSLLVCEWSDGNVSAYNLDANGDPILATRELFIAGLEGAEGAVIDPLTGDFLFSTFGGGDRVLVVQGFVPPPPPVPATNTYLVWLLAVVLAAAVGYGQRRVRQARLA